MKKIVSYIWAFFAAVILPIAFALVIGRVFQLIAFKRNSYEPFDNLLIIAFICYILFGVILAYIMTYRVDHSKKLRSFTPLSISIFFTIISLLNIVLFFPLYGETFYNLFGIIISYTSAFYMLHPLLIDIYYIYLGLILYKTFECWYYYLTGGRREQTMADGTKN